MRCERWKPDEDKILSDNVGIHPDEMAKLFSDRTPKAVKSRMYLLGYRTLTHTEWTPEELKTLRLMWPSYTGKELQTALPKHTFKGIHKKADELGLVKFKMDAKRNNVSWPGFEGGRMAYDMTTEELKRPPKKPPRDMSVTTHPAMAELKNFFLDRTA